jgi:hypothetical protein
MYRVIKINSMKTAIEQMMVDLEESLFGDSKLTTKEIWDKALESEKQQIVEAYNIGCINGEIIERDIKPKYSSPIQYYNEKFKK